ncbi:C-type mannose receptor 2-like isoform 1-T1 [Menidia menidia]
MGFFTTPEMRVTPLLVLTLSGMSALPADLFREYHYVNIPKTWADAQRYCRDVYVDLATVQSPAEHKRLMGIVPPSEKQAWIGLSDNLISWKWTHGNVKFNNSADYSNWKPGQPDNKDSNESCVVMQHDGLWRDENCLTDRPSVCFDGTKSKHILVDTFMTWNESKTMCRSVYTDLAQVRSFDENEKIHPLLSRNAWIGLYRRRWAQWSDQTPRRFRNWDVGQPDNSGGTMRSCAAVHTSTGKWWDSACEEKLEFICQTLVPPRSRFQLRVQSEADLSQPAVQQQLLEQLRAELGARGLTDLRLRWVQTDGRTFHPETGRKAGPGN